MLTSISFAQNREWTLQECIAYALENNISIKQSELDLEQARIDKVGRHRELSYPESMLPRQIRGTQV